jgi:membrane fusion protein, multidrug efflux system
MGRDGGLTMSRRAIVLVALGAIVVAVATSSLLHSSERTAKEKTTKSRSADAVIRAAGVRVAPAHLRATIETVGTLVANESVRVVSELSRRLVRVHVGEGVRVEKNALLFELDDTDLVARLQELEARRKLAARTVERQRALMSEAKKALSAQAFDQSSAELAALAAQIDAAKVTLAKTKIRAPFAGTVGLRRVSEGAWVTPETELTTLHDTSHVKIDFAVPERYAPSVASGRTFRFRVAGQGDAFEGSIVAVAPAIAAETRTLLVRGIAENRENKLIPGGFVSVELPIEDAGGGVAVPAQAVVPSAKGHGVFVLAGGRAELRAVEIGLRTADEVQVLSGLSAGETVLTTNLLRLAPGMKVELESAGS